MRFFLGSVLVVLVVHLIFGGHPWEEGVPRRLAEGKPIRPVDYWVTYGYWLALANAVIVALLLATQRRWFDDAPAPERPATLPAVERPGRLWLAMVAGAVVIGTLGGVPRLDHSLWGDEHYSVVRAIHGQYRLENGKLEFEQVKLRNTFWYYRKPNNHVFHSLLARTSIGVWELATRPERRIPPGAVVRLPALLGGALSIAAVAALAWLLGAPRAGVLAAWVLALHPWHTRYLSEARGYSIAMALVTLLSIAMVLALQHGSWRRWSTYGVLQVLLLWTNPGAVYHVLLTNLVVLGAVIAFDRGTPHLRSQLTRFAFVNLAGALFWLLMMTPNLLQLAQYLGDNPSVETPALRWLRDYGSHLLTGMRWSHGSKGGPIHAELAHTVPWLRVLWIGFASTALVLGSLRLARAGGLRAALLPVFLLPAPLFVAQSLIRGDFIYPWYAIFLLPSAALLVAFGVEGVARLVRRPEPAFAVLAAGTLVVMAAVVWPVHVGQWRYPIYADRGSAEATRPHWDPFTPENQRIVTLSWSEPPSYYDPLIREVESREAVLAELRAADAHGKELLVNLGRLDLQEKRRPDMMALVRTPELFEEVWVGHGSLPWGTRRVWRYVPGSVEAFSHGETPPSDGVPAGGTAP